ncbi:6402_t:CDS:2 [Paraglomus occultum]|uniref:6402_t:CDS:1 n=1 Tax=Paraglomus occultum TaxID=144539 RepID=A0A9N8Z3D7_9GLOM|nr:6402_t:CDS:2 [Paraglomus occultum]
MCSQVSIAAELTHVPLSIIFNFLHEEVDNHDSLLLPCIYVNKHWSEVAIPILWQAPFQKGPINPIYTLLSFAEEDKLKEVLLTRPHRALKRRLLKKPPLFPYPRYIRQLDIVPLAQLCRNVLAPQVRPLASKMVEIMSGWMIGKVLEVFNVYGARINCLRVEGDQVTEEHITPINNPTCRQVFASTKKLIMNTKVSKEQFFKKFKDTCQQVGWIECNFFNPDLTQNPANELESFCSFVNAQKTVTCYRVHSFGSQYYDTPLLTAPLRKHAPTIRILRFEHQAFRTKDVISDIASCRNVECLSFIHCTLTDSCIEDLLISTEFPNLVEVNITTDPSSQCGDASLKIWLWADDINMKYGDESEEAEFTDDDESEDESKGEPKDENADNDDKNEVESDRNLWHIYSENVDIESRMDDCDYYPSSYESDPNSDV